jgi:hypothetical protein
MDEFDEYFGENGESEEPMGEIQELVWALLDEQIADEELLRLEQLLRESPEARRSYLACVRMHSDLHCMFAERSGDRPIGLPLVDFPLPSDEVPLHNHA